MKESITTTRLALAEYRTRSWEEKLREINTMQPAWQIQRALRRPSNIIPPLPGPNGIKYEDHEKAEIFTDTLEQILTENMMEEEELNYERTVEEAVRRIRSHETDQQVDRYVTPQEISEILKRTKQKKAPGEDGVKNKMLKELPPRATGDEIVVQLLRNSSGNVRQHIRYKLNTLWSGRHFLERF